MIYFAGSQKAVDILIAILSSTGSQAWVGCEPALHSLMGHIAQDFRTEMVRAITIL